MCAVIVDYDSWDQTARCVRSLRAARSGAGPLSILVVDNAGTVPTDAETWLRQDDVTVLRPGGNLGYAGGNNLGMRHARAAGHQLAWLLNPDTVASPEATQELLALASAHPEASFYGTWVTTHTGHLEYVAGVFDETWGRASVVPAALPEPGQVAAVDWINGCSLVVRLSVLDEGPPMDEHYFLYREELEWQLRMREQGVARPLVLGRSLVVHETSAVTGATGSSIKPVFMARNQLLLMRGRPALVRLRWWIHWCFEHVLYPVYRGAAVGQVLRNAWTAASSTRTPPRDLLAALLVRPDRA